MPAPSSRLQLSPVSFESWMPRRHHTVKTYVWDGKTDSQLHSGTSRWLVRGLLGRDLKDLVYETGDWREQGSSTAVAPASALLTMAIISAYFRLIRRPKTTAHLRIGFLSSDRSGRELEDLARTIFCGAGSAFDFSLWPITWLSVRTWCRVISALSRRGFCTLFQTNLDTDTVKDGMPLVRFAASFVRRGSARQFWTVVSIALWKAELGRALTTDQLTSLRITAKTAVPVFHFLARTAAVKSLTTVSSNTTGSLVNQSHTVFSSQSDEREWVDQIL